MSKLKLHAPVLVLLCVAWVDACGGSAFNAAGGAAGTSASGSSSITGGNAPTGGSAPNGGSAPTGGSAPSGGSSSIGGDESGGSVGVAGSGEAGASEGGGAEGGSSSAGAAGSAHGGSAGSAGTSGVRNSGDCDIDKDCGSGNKCVALSVNGFRTCVVPVPAPTTCTASSDQCCPSDPNKTCAMGKNCVRAPLAPSCGLVMVANNVCAAPQCSVNADCAGTNAICAPAGSLDRKINTCLTGGCRRDVECKDIAGGKCEPVTSNCCDGPNGLYCVYPGKGCRSSADCAAGSTCQIVNQKTGECVTGAGVCAL